MPQAQHQQVRAPEGMGSSIDPGAVPEKWARRIRGFLPGRNGTLRVSPGLVEALNTLGTNAVTGLAWYENPFPVTQSDYDAGILRNDRLVALRGGLEIWTYPVAFDLNNLTLSIGGGTHVGDIDDIEDGNVFYNLNMRTAAYQGEMYIVAGDGCTPHRFYMDDAGDQFLYPLGIATPAAPTAALGAAGALTGDYTYKITYTDNLGRESSPSDASNTITATADRITVSFSWGTDPQVASVKIYRNTAGDVSVWYLVTEITNTVTVSYSDNNTDASIQGNDKAPDPGVNDPPHRASLISVWGYRLILNDRNIYDDPADIECITRLQVSNLQKMSQFNSDNWTSVGNSASDEMTVVSPYGAVLHIATRTEIYQIFGTTPLGDAITANDFSDLMDSKFLVGEGCAAPDSWTHCKNSICYLGNSGPKRLVMGAGFSVENIGIEIQDYFQGVVQQVTS